jgi:prophage antirepressor-like protein
MGNELVNLSFENHEVRIIDRDGTLWFVVKDVCDVLGYDDASRAVSNHCKDDTLNKRIIELPDSMGRKQPTTIISELNIYRLIMRSKKPESEKFQDWVCGEVLPSIRKTGSYVSTETKIEKLEDENQRFRLKLLMFEEYQSDELVGYDEGAALISIYRKPPFGVKHFKQWMADNGIICTPFYKNDKPVQKYIDIGWFKCVAHEYWRNGKRRYENRYLLTWRGVSGLIDLAINEKLITIPADMKHQYLPGVCRSEENPVCSI